MSNGFHGSVCALFLFQMKMNAVSLESVRMEGVSIWRAPIGVAAARDTKHLRTARAAKVVFLEASYSWLHVFSSSIFKGFMQHNALFHGQVE